MRVNITYSVDLEEISDVVSKMLKEVREKFDYCGAERLEDIQTYLADENEKKACEHILLVRKELATLDMRLADCHDILKGYQKARFDEGNTGGGDEPTGG